MVGNFLASVRGEARPHCGVELAVSTMIGVAMISRAMRERRTMIWDASTDSLAEA